MESGVDGLDVAPAQPSDVDMTHAVASTSLVQPIMTTSHAQHKAARPVSKRHVLAASALGGQTRSDADMEL
jgi:hypothetical protein